MGAQLKFLDSNRVTALSAYSWGNVLAASSSTPKLIFINSYGDADALEVEFAIEAVAGNDGYTMAEFCEAGTMTAIASVITGTVFTTGGTIPLGLVIEYKVTVKDRWGHESAPSASYQPTFVTGSTNKVDLVWDAVTGAYQYTLYSSVSGAGFFKVADSVTASYTDTAGTNDGLTTPPVTGSVAYKAGTWRTALLAIGTMTHPLSKPMMIRNTVPSGTTSVANPRRFKTYVNYQVT